MCVHAFRPQIHREKRKYLRTSLKELAVVFTDQPGLLGPKVLCLMSLMMMMMMKDVACSYRNKDVDSRMSQLSTVLLNLKALKT